MKKAVSSYSFHHMMNQGEIREAELIPLAKEMGFDAIEFAEISPNPGLTKAEYAKILREESERVGLPILNYAIAANFAQTEKDDLHREVERVCGEVDIAEILGAKLMRHDVANGISDSLIASLGFEGILPSLAEGARAVTVYAEKKGIRTMTENHGFFCQDISRMEALFHAVGHPNYGLLLDMGNFLCIDEDPVKAFRALTPYAFHIHAKDFHTKKKDDFVPPDGFFKTRGGNYLRGAIIGHGEVPVLDCLKILKEAGYAGDCTLEFEGMEEEKTGVACGMNSLKEMEKILSL